MHGDEGRGAKAQLSEVKPLGAKLDATRAALARAAERKSKAENALSLAQECLTAATDEHEAIATDLAELEAQVVSNLVAPPLLALQETLEAMVGLMAQSGVTEELSTQAKQQCDLFLNGFKVIFSQAPSASTTATAPAVKPPNNKLTDKQPPRAPPAAPPPAAPALELATVAKPVRRVVGKKTQPTIGNYFGAPKLSTSPYGGKKSKEETERPRSKSPERFGEDVPVFTDSDGETRAR